MKKGKAKLSLLISISVVTVLLQGCASKAKQFDATWESLQQYQAPEWFRDAKFGIWAHWGPQAVPGQGDWYARRMYLQGDGAYNYHVKTYGHPSEFGYKDIIPLWKAENWDPDYLMSLYKKAGAKYFVSMAVHHDNFDLWDSTYHRWNAVKMGPQRDIVGQWQAAAEKYGLRFGVSEHLAASFRMMAATPNTGTFTIPNMMNRSAAVKSGTARIRSGTRPGISEYAISWTSTSRICSIPTAVSPSAKSAGGWWLISIMPTCSSTAANCRRSIPARKWARANSTVRPVCRMSSAGR
jgi:hypothetical protein